MGVSGWAERMEALGHGIKGGIMVGYEDGGWEYSYSHQNKGIGELDLILQIGCQFTEKQD
jgi:hypothetical protein